MHGMTRHRGFTLIELLVVMLLVTIVLGMVGLGFFRDHSTEVQEEAERLATVLQAAQHEAAVQGQVYALRFTPEGYQFLRLDTAGKFTAIERDDVLMPRRLPPPMTVRHVSIEGIANREQSGIVLDPGGALPPFTVTFGSGDAEWRVTGKINGTITTARPETHAP
jgi:general secretion pathway protein H